MGFYIFYAVAIIILILHFTGWLKRNNLEWIVLVLAVATFPAVIFSQIAAIISAAGWSRSAAASPPGSC